MGLDNLVYPYTINTSERDTDFTGFSFNGFHSNLLGLVRVSSSNRYDDELVPSFTDKTIVAPGSDRTYYFGTDFTERKFTLNVAFDNVTEERLRMIRQVFQPKAVGPLIFDEWPYKVYSAKVAAPPQFKYVCFELGKDENGNYKSITVPTYVENVQKIDNTTVYINLYNIMNNPIKDGSYTNFINNLNILPTRTGGPSLEILNNLEKSIKSSTYNIVSSPSNNKGIIYYDETNGILTINFSLETCSLITNKFGTGYYVKFCYSYEISSRRLYKGEATISFICHYPFAKSRYKFSSSYESETRDWRSRWMKAAGIIPRGYTGNSSNIIYEYKQKITLKASKQSKSVTLDYVPISNNFEFSPGEDGTPSAPRLEELRVARQEGSKVIEIYIDPEATIEEWQNGHSFFIKYKYADNKRYIDFNYYIKNEAGHTLGGTFMEVYNPGDLEADARFYFSVSENATPITDLILTDYNNFTTVTTTLPEVPILAHMKFKTDFTKIKRNNNDVYICIDTAKNLIYGCNNQFLPTGSLYNDFLIAGNFFKIPITPKRGYWANDSSHYNGKSYYLYLKYTEKMNQRGFYGTAPHTEGQDINPEDTNYQDYIEDFYSYLYY